MFEKNAKPLHIVKIMKLLLYATDLYKRTRLILNPFKEFLS